MARPTRGTLRVARCRREAHRRFGSLHLTAQSEVHRFGRYPWECFDSRRCRGLGEPAGVKTLPAASVASAALPTLEAQGWPGFRLPSIAWLGFGLTVVGAAGSVAVMLGLIGIPLVVAGILVTAAISPTLVRPTFGKGRTLLARVLALAAGLTAALSAPAFAATAATHLLAISRGRLPATSTVLGAALAAHWALWLATVIAGGLAIWAARGRDAGRDLDAVILWGAYAPATVLLLEWLHLSGLIALSA